MQTRPGCGRVQTGAVSGPRVSSAFTLVRVCGREIVGGSPLRPHTDTNTLARVARLLPLEKSTFAHNTGNTPDDLGKPGSTVRMWQGAKVTSEIGWRKWLKRSCRRALEEQVLARFVPAEPIRPDRRCPWSLRASEDPDGGSNS